MPTKEPAPLRTLRRKRDKRNVAGMLCIFEIDPSKVSDEDLEELMKKSSDDNDAKAIAGWIISHGQLYVFDDGVKTYHKTYKDVTDKEDTYGGRSVWAWKVMFVTMFILMILGTLSQAWLAGVAIANGETGQALLNFLLFLWDGWVTHRLRLLMKRFWYRGDTL